VAMTAAVLVGVLAWWLRSSESFVLVYLAPVVIAAWWLGPTSAVLVASTAAAAFGVSTHALQPTLPLVMVLWESFTHLTIFVALGLTVARMHHSQERLAEATARLADMVDRERLLARTDPHTGLPNFRALLEYLGSEIERSRQLRRRLVIAYVDIDDFKKVNDKHGHAAGNDLLATIAALIRDNLRSTDICARVGGDEFAVVFIDEHADVRPVLRRLARRIAEVGSCFADAKVSASIGMATFDTAPASADAALHCADQAMYAAKAAGKAKIFSYDASSATLEEAT
jgi:diguanylate cyclase (GGDEF)-like protein